MLFQLKTYADICISSKPDTQMSREDAHRTYSPAVSFIPDGYMDRFSSSEGSAKAGVLAMGENFLNKG